MSSMTKALVASLMLVNAAGAMAQAAPMQDDRTMCSSKPDSERTSDERQRCAAMQPMSADAASSAARSNLAGGIVVGSIVLATVIVAVTGGNDGLDTVAPTPIIPPVPTTTTTATTTTTSTR